MSAAVALSGYSLSVIIYQTELDLTLSLVWCVWLTYVFCVSRCTCTENLIGFLLVIIIYNVEEYRNNVEVDIEYVNRNSLVIELLFCELNLYLINTRQY